MGQCLIFASTNFINDFIKLFQGSNDRHIRLILSTQSQPASFAGPSISMSPHKAEGKRQENGKEKHEMKKGCFQVGQIYSRTAGSTFVRMDLHT
jgi:hypothetical protein